MPAYHGFAVLGTPSPGQVPVYQANGSVAWGDAGGAGAPLSTVSFVDPGTTVPLADQDGSVGAPFATLQAAVTAAPDSSTIIVCPSAGGAGNAAWDAKALTFFGLALGINVGSTSTQAQIGTLTTTGLARIFLQNIRAGAIDTAQVESSAVVARDSVLAAVTTDLFRANNCVIGGSVNSASGSQILDSTFEAGVEFTGNCEIDATSYMRAANALVVFNTPQTYIEGSSAVRNESGVVGDTVTNALDELAP